MTHEEIEQYLKDKDLNTFEYQLAMDAMLFAEQKTIEKACDWIQMDAMKYVNSIGGCMYFDVINSTKDFKKVMEL